MSAKPEHTVDRFRGRTPAEWAAVEAEEHDRLYRGAYPFGRRQFTFTVEQALAYEDYCFKPGRDRWGHRTRKFLELLTVAELPSKTVLDIGSGTGQLAVLYAMCGAQVTGVDLSRTGTQIAIRSAQANGVAHRCRFIAGEFSVVDLPARAFDIVTLHAVLHHLIKYPGAKDKIARLVKPGGMILAVDTVRGGSILHAFRRAVKLVVPVTRRRHEEDLGDALFGIETYEEWASQFPRSEIHMMDCFYMINKVFERIGTEAAPARLVLRLAALSDEFLATMFPAVRRSFGNAVLLIRT